MNSIHRRSFLKRATGALALSGMIPAAAQHDRKRNLSIEFGTSKMVFADWWFVEAGYGLPFSQKQQKELDSLPIFMPRGVKLKVGKPVLTEHPILRPDKPTDGETMGGYTTLLKDGGKYRLWYESYLPGMGTDEEANICYAESDNGVDWTKPAVGIFEYRGTKANNLVYKRGHGASIFIDPTAKPSERYKMIHLDKVPLQEYKGKLWDAFLFGAVSPDGIHWTRQEGTLIKHTSDTQSVAEYDPETKKYVAYLRGWEPQINAGYGGRRIVVRVESNEFGNFSDPQPVLAMGPADPPDVDIYTNAFQRWPGASRAYLMTPAMFHRSSDHVDLQLATSHDGVRWFFPQQEPFLANGEPGSGYEGAMYAGRGTVPLGPGKWAFPMSGYYRTHNMYFHATPQQPSHGAVWLCQLREDGYMGVEAEGAGEFWTQPATFTGSRLLINCYGITGSRLRVGFTDRAGKPLPGFSVNECDGLRGDNLWSAMRWGGKEDLSSLRGQQLRVHFELSRMRLHAFQFA